MDCEASGSNSPNVLSTKLFQSTVEYYGITAGECDWRVDSKPGSKSNGCVSPFDLSDGLRRNSNLWKEGIFVNELGLGDDKVDVVRDMLVPMGLKNMGATCYVNSFLQSLFMNQEFTSLILALAIPDASTELLAFQNLLAEMKYGKSKYADPKQFVDALSIGHDLQEDCSEFSTLFLTWLEHALADHSSAQDIRSFFEGQFETILNCSLCGDERRLTEPFMELRLELPDSGVTDLDQLLHAAMQYEDTIDGYFCSACSQCTVLIKTTSVVKTPPYLQLAINRYRFKDGLRRKVTSPVKVPISKNITMLGSEYTCTGFLEHISSSATSGHYIAHLRDEASGWWTFDDMHVSGWGASGAFKASQSVYMVFLSSRFGDANLRTFPATTRALREVDIKNDLLVARRDLLVTQQAAVKEQVSDRKARIEKFDLPQNLIPSQVRVIDKSFFVSWCRGEDILGKFNIRENSPFVNNSCSHGDHTFSPMTVFRSEVKFIPHNVAEAMSLPFLPLLSDSVCEICVGELESLLSDALEYFGLIDELKSIKMNFWQMRWERGDIVAEGYLAEEDSVWVNLSELPRMSNKIFFASKLALFRKVSRVGPGTVEAAPVDLSAGVMCAHGVVVSDVLSDASFALKPKKLVERITTIALKIFPAMNSLLPWITVHRFALYDPSDYSSPCPDCEREAQSLSGERKILIDQLTRLVTSSPPARFEPGVTYVVLPGVWVSKVDTLLARQNLRAFPEIKLNGTLICPHGDLLVDPTDTDNKDQKYFLIPESDAAFLVDDFLNKDSKDQVSLPIVQRDAVNFTLGCAPPVCASCSAKTTTPKISVRVLPEIENCFENLGPSKKSHKPSRSKLIGVTQGSIDMNSLGIDVKTHLIDIGVLEHSLYDIPPEEAIERIKIFVANPSVRGALIEVSSGACLGDLIQEDSHLDTIYVEFTQDPQEEPAHIRHKIRKISKRPPESENAGFKGSLLRDR